ncbi:hypothetical protein [Niabella aurantiaca]|uniref:hypothetical protein n=1 Tax=Niabella aurantiaca TaxID=379900 RepID=UPI00036B0621|nr:hypothetical protein [Niabella aurantiaca]
MLQILLTCIPQLIIAGALLYYLVRKRDMLSGVLFVSYLASFVAGLLRLSLSIRHDLKNELHNIVLRSYVSSIAYTVFAIAFVALIINILRPVLQTIHSSANQNNQTTYS